MRLIFFITVITLTFLTNSSIAGDTTRVYIFDMKEDIMPGTWRKTQKAFKEAKKWDADVILIHVNTYGGMLVAADSIRTSILNSEIPVWVFIDNNAVSAGALISIAAEKIFMKHGGTIGSATVVNQQGEPMPDKYQSFMRSLMRATAEAHGSDTIVTGRDTTFVWKRNPHIAEAMVDPDVTVEGISQEGKVLALTTREAINHNYCNAEVKNIDEILSTYATDPYVTKKQELTALDHIINFFISPVVQGLLIMLIIGGIYFELQTPGVGFPLAVAILATLLYFVPLYIEGVAAYWEIILFIIGIILVIIEIFATPGFGVLGISGAIMIIASLSLAMIDSVEFRYNPMIWAKITRSLLIVTLFSTISIFTSIWLGGKLFKSTRIKILALHDTQEISEGYVGIDVSIKSMVGKCGVATTDLRPSGTVEIESVQYDAKAMHGYIETGSNITVVRDEMAQLYVRKNS